MQSLVKPVISLSFRFLSIVAIFSPFIFFSCNSEKSDALPNIIIIFTDDQGYGDVGSYGATGFETPNIDKMASEGMRFTSFYSAQAVCSASRAGLLTGCYPNRIGITGALMPYSKIGIAPGEMTIAELLKQKGYRTAIFGKWHLGYQEQFLPLQHGFDEYTGLPYSNDMWPVDFDGTPITPGSPREDKLKYPPLPLVEGNITIDTIATLSDQDRLTLLYTSKAVDFITRNRNNPFFLYVPHSMPHVPLGVSPAFRGKSEQGLYGDVMMEIDWSVGEILKAVEENGLTGNTLVIFATDNGPWLNFGNHAGSTAGLREGKGTSFEGGQRVPCIIKWPGVIPEGEITNRMATTLDIMPTIAHITGTTLPEHRIDGINIISILKGEGDANPREDFLYYYGRNNLEAVRSGDFKLVFPHHHRSYEGVMPGNDGWPGAYRDDYIDAPELYDLRRDPGERYNVIEIYPHIAEKLEQIAINARADLGDDLTGVTGTGTREPGRSEK